MSGHPAFAVPCGRVGELPIGMMLVSHHFDEATMISAGQAFEQIGDWQSRRTSKAHPLRDKRPIAKGGRRELVYYPTLLHDQDALRQGGD